jgi:hypothetical protein
VWVLCPVRSVVHTPLCCLSVLCLVVRTYVFLEVFGWLTAAADMFSGTLRVQFILEMCCGCRLVASWRWQAISLGGALACWLLVW